MEPQVPTDHDKMRKVLKWVSEQLSMHPEKTRKQVLEEAEFHFDLSPQDCEFLNRHFAK